MTLCQYYYLPELFHKTGASEHILSAHVQCMRSDSLDIADCIHSYFPEGFATRRHFLLNRYGLHVVARGQGQHLLYHELVMQRKLDFIKTKKKRRLQMT